MSDSPVIVPFTRPDGEARLEWTDVPTMPEGGYVRIWVDGEVGTNNSHYSSDSAGLCDQVLTAKVGVDAAKAILLAAEKLRNEKRKLAKDGSEWRGEAAVYSFSQPDLLGCRVQTDGGPFAMLSFTSIAGSKLLEAVKPWHRATFLPLLPDDCAYPEGELPRRMQPDEVRFPDGSAGRMYWNGKVLCVTGTERTWDVSPTGNGCTDSDCLCNSPSQLARLQAFWDANQPKEAELNLRWSGNGKAVCFDFAGSSWSYADGWHSPQLRRMSPSQRAKVEAFFAAGPPVELAEDEMQAPAGPQVGRRTMRIVNGLLYIYTENDDLSKPPAAYMAGLDRFGLERRAKDFAHNPLGWPRALAYFDRHVKREPTFARCPTCGQPGDAGHCPVRVTDVRLGLDRDVDFTFKGRAYFYYGEWCNKELHAELHPLDIALIERCWAEGQRPACVPADVTEWTRIEGRVVWRAGSGQIRISGCEKDHWPKMAWTMWPESKLGEFDCTSVAPSLFHAARKWAGWDVTPSGEVKAPFGLEWIEDEADPEVGIKGGQSCHVGNVHCFTNPAPHVDIAIGGVGTVEERLRAAHAALSDHIRRGDEPIDWADPAKLRNIGYALCPNCQASYDPRQGHTCRLSVKPAPDLTELREAREKQMAYLSLSPDSRSPLQETVNVRAVFAAVERLVGK